MTPGAKYRELLESFRKIAIQYKTDVAALAHQEEETFQYADRYVNAFYGVRYNNDEAIIGLAERIFDRLIRTAELQFAPAGGKLSIDNAKVRKIVDLRSEEDWLNLNPEKVWNYLESTYGQGAGEEEGWRQQAKELVSVFNLDCADHIRMIGGKTVLSLSVYIDHIDKKFFNRVNISSSSAQKLYKALVNLMSFAAWAGLNDLAQDLQSMQCLADSHRPLKSRASYGGNGVKVVTFQNNFEFHFEKNVAEQLQIFVSIYGQPATCQAAWTGDLENPTSAPL